MKKETFVAAIEAIKKQCEHDKQFAEHLAKAFPDAFNAQLMPDNHFLSNALAAVLSEVMNDTNDWISHFCWELDFGHENYRLAVFDKNRNEIPLSTIDDLYNLLTEEQALQETIGINNF